MKRAISLLCPCFAAVALVVAAALPALAAPEPPGPGGVSDSALITVIAGAGDDVFSTTDIGSLIDPAGTATQHYGPFPSDSPDSGTCGPDWAKDTFDRHFTVRFNPDGSTTVVEQFKNGAFTTIDGASPGACETGTNHGTAVTGGKVGSMHGYFVIPIPAGFTEFNNSPYCDGASSNTDCTTATFINSHFTCTYGVTCSVSTFFFHYAAGDQSLIFHEWKNASPDRGGNDGDIATT